MELLRSDLADEFVEQAVNRKLSPTAGHQDVLDVVLGSTSEQVLRRTPCPVFAVAA